MVILSSYFYSNDIWEDNSYSKGLSSFVLLGNNMERKKDFEFIEHTADVKVRVFGITLKEIFQNSLDALFQIVLPKARGCSLVDGYDICKSFPIDREISISSHDKESLLVDFLTEVLCLMDTYGEAYGEISIKILSDTSIEATLHGISVITYQGQDVKAVTYHDLKIEKVDDQWQAIIVFDV